MMNEVHITLAEQVMSAKRPYQKPRMLVESLQMAQSIANDCSGVGDSNDGSAQTCSWSDGAPGVAEVYFANETAGCQTLIVGDSFDFGVVCYNNPTAGLSIFGS